MLPEDEEMGRSPSCGEVMAKRSEKPGFSEPVLSTEAVLATWVLTSGLIGGGTEGVDEAGAAGAGAAAGGGGFLGGGGDDFGVSAAAVEATTGGAGLEGGGAGLAGGAAGREGGAGRDGGGAGRPGGWDGLAGGGAGRDGGGGFSGAGSVVSGMVMSSSSSNDSWDSWDSSLADSLRRLRSLSPQRDTALSEHSLSSRSSSSFHWGCFSLMVRSCPQTLICRLAVATIFFSSSWPG